MPPKKIKLLFAGQTIHQVSNAKHIFFNLVTSLKDRNKFKIYSFANDEKKTIKRKCHIGFVYHRCQDNDIDFNKFFSSIFKAARKCQEVYILYGGIDTSEKFFCESSTFHLFQEQVKNPLIIQKTKIFTFDRDLSEKQSTEILKHINKITP